MKKFFAFLLTFVMLFSLAMPTMAAEVTGNTEGEVSGTFNPEIEITGMKVTSDFELRYDESTGIYIAVINPQSPASGTGIQCTFLGKNLEYLTRDDTLRKVFQGNKILGDWTLTAEDLINYNFVDKIYGYKDGNSVEWQYTNDGGTTWSDVVRVEARASYYVTVNASENGTVTASEYAIAGETVNLNVSPAEGYMLDTLTVMNGETPVEVTDNSFTMPASAVTISATFELAPVSHDITITPPENGTVEADLDKATAGTTVTLTVVPADDYRLATLTINDGAVTATKVDDTTYTFAMPDAEVTVNATFEKIPHNITIAESENGAVTADKETATAGETVTLTATPATGYQIDSVTVTDAEGNTVDFTETGVASGTYKFTMPASNVTVAATFKELPVTSVAITWGSMEFTYDDTVAEGATTETGWTCAAGANQVTVTNGNESAITASVEYKQETGYEAINGYFAAESATASADLNLNEAHTFTLTLSGKPEAAITAGTKIGSVTVTIEEYNPVYLNFSFASANGMTYKKHKIEFFDASEASIYVTEPSTETTNTVAVPSNAVTFQILVDFIETFNGIPIDHNWDYYGSDKIAVPEETSNVAVTMRVNYTITPVQ